MTKKKWIVLICVLVLFAAIFTYFLWYNGFFLSKDSAMVCAEYLEYNGKIYIPASGKDYTEGRTIAKDRNWSIMEIKEDPSHTYIVARSFLDQQLYVLQDYVDTANGN